MLRVAPPGKRRSGLKRQPEKAPSRAGRSRVRAGVTLYSCLGHVVPARANGEERRQRARPRAALSQRKAAVGDTGEPRGSPSGWFALEGKVRRARWRRFASPPPLLLMLGKAPGIPTATPPPF